MHSLIVLALAGAWFVRGASIPKEPLQLFEIVNQVPEEWEEIGTPDSVTEISLSLILTAEDPARLETTLYQISSPGRDRYGQHLERDQLKEVIRPSARGRQNVLDWLNRSGANITHDKGEKINFRTTVGKANSMLGCDFRTYQHTSDPRETRIRTLKVMLPAEVHGHIDLVHPTTYFEQLRPLRSVIHDVKYIEQEIADPSCATRITPACLHELYNISGVDIPDPNKAGILGVAGFLEGYARFSDLAKFLRGNPSKVPIDANFTWSSVKGGLLKQDGPAVSLEANLDIQYTMAISYPVQNHFYSTGGIGALIPDLDQPDVSKSQNEPFQDLFSHLLDVETADKLPHTLSISYAENEQSVPESYTRAVCNQIAQLGARGVSVLGGSGDDGVGSVCKTNDGTNKVRFTPMFPSNCPYMTSVGGTTGINPEKAVSFSSGGFSDRFPRPAYQEAHVTKFLKDAGAQYVQKFAEYFNQSGRGYPDISAQAANFRIIDKGRSVSIGGTSASTPVVAGMIGLLNGHRVQQGQPPLGFLNPWIYSSNEKIVTDIVQGKSTGCTGRSKHTYRTGGGHIPGAMWPAVRGWDPVTGVGTPKFGEMLKNLPAQNGTVRGALRNSENSQLQLKCCQLHVGT